MKSDIDKRKIELDEPLRQLGSHEVIVRLAKDAEVTITVHIEDEAAPEEKPPEEIIQNE